MWVAACGELGGGGVRDNALIVWPEDGREISDMVAVNMWGGISRRVNKGCCASNGYF